MKIASINFSLFLKKQQTILIAALCLSCAVYICMHFFLKQYNYLFALKEIPQEERFSLEVFFRSLISDEDGYCVFYGDKPASVTFFKDWKKIDRSRLPSRYSMFFSPEKRGMEIWEKYQHLFPLKTYALVKTRSFFPEYSAAVFLIHKERLRNTLIEEFDEFKRVFSKIQSPEQLLEAILYDPSFLAQICLNHHDNLLGIILGYGKENAAYFYRQWEIKTFLFPREYSVSESFIFNPLKKPIPRPGYSSLEEELLALKAKSGNLIIPEKCSLTFSLHLPIGYSVDATVTDVPGLRKKYKEQQYRATKAYQNGSFLEITLREMMR